MAKPPSRYLKDIDALCAALGIKLPAQRNRANKLRAPVIAWTRGEELPAGAPPFPAKTKYGWEREAVVKWNEERKKGTAGKQMGDGRWEMGRSKNTQLATANADLPTQTKPADGELFHMETAAEKFKKRLEFLLDIYLNPETHVNQETGALRRLTMDEKRELQAAGMLPKLDLSETAPPEGDEIYGGVEGIANAIMKEFPGTVVHAQYVSDWLKGKRYPCTKPGVPPMPPPHQSGRHKRSLVFPWYREYVLPEQAQAPKELGMQGGMADARSRKEAADAEMAELAAKQMREADDKNYVRRDVFFDLMAECGVIVYGNCNRFEGAFQKRLSAHLQERAVPESERARCMEWVRVVLPDAIDALRNEIAAGINGVQARTKQGN